MAKIEPVVFPILGTATQLNVLVLNFATDATTCTTYYQLMTDDGKQCAQGNYTLTEAEYAAWGEDNAYIDGVVANHIGVTIVVEEEVI